MPECSAADGGLSEADYLAAFVAPDLIQYAGLELVCRASIERLADDAGVELRLFADQPKVNNGIRAEVAIDAPFVDGDTVRYEWSVWLPPDFQADPQNRWWVMADWHDQPDRNLGETWEGYLAHSAALIVGYGRLEAGQTVEGFSVDATSDVFSLTYGTDHRAIGLVPFRRGEWVRLRLDVAWSQSAAGQAAMWVNGEKKLTATGPNMFNAFQQYFKAGMYRDPAIHTPNSVRLSNIVISHVR